MFCITSHFSQWGFSVAEWLEVTITLLNYIHSLSGNDLCNIITINLWWLLRQYIIDECFSKDTVAEIIKSFVSFFISLSDSNFPLKMFTIIWYVGLQLLAQFTWMILWFPGSRGRQRRKWMDRSSAEGIKEVFTNRIENNTKIGNNLLLLVCHNRFSYVNWWFDFIFSPLTPGTYGFVHDICFINWIWL